MKKLLCLIPLALASCSGGGATDGYTFEQTSTLLSPKRDIRIVLFPSLSSLKAAYDRNKNSSKMSSNRELMAYSVISGTTCTISMIDPKVKYMPEFFGHELTHCLYGEFHPSQNG